MHHREDPCGSETNTHSVPPPEYERAPSVHREVGPENERRQRPGRGDPRCRDQSQQHAEHEVITTPLTLVATVNVTSEEHTSELQSPDQLVCRLLLEKKNKTARF